MSYEYAQLLENFREGADDRSTDLRSAGQQEDDDDDDSDSSANAPPDRTVGATHSFPSGGPSKPMSWLNTEQNFPSVDWTDENTLKHLGLSLETFKKKKPNAPLLDNHMKEFRSSADIFRWSKFSLSDQLAAKKMGIRSYDPHILLHKRKNDTQRRHVLRQQLDVGHLDASNKMPRKKEHVLDFFLESSPEIRKLEPLFPSKHVDNCVKFFEDFQFKTAAELPQHKFFTQALIQLLGEEWYALLCVRKFLPVLTKVLHDLDSQLPNHPSIKFLQTMRWNLHNIAEITAMHDSFIATARVAAKYDSNPKAWNCFIEKMRIRRGEYRFQEQENSYWTPYADMVVDPDAVERKLKRDNDSHKRRQNQTSNGGRKNGANNGGKGGKGKKKKKKAKKKNKDKGNNGGGKNSRKRKSEKPEADPPTKVPFNPHKNKKCHLCGTLGHIQSNCPSKGWKN